MAEDYIETESVADGEVALSTSPVADSEVALSTKQISTKQISTFTLYDSAGNVIESISANDETYGAGGVGMQINHSGVDGQFTGWFDYLYIDSRDTLIDSMEDGNMSEYTVRDGPGGVGSATASIDTTMAFDGSNSWKVVSDGGAAGHASSTSGLPAYPKPGDTFSTRVQWNDGTIADMAFKYALADETNNYTGYQARVDAHLGQDGDTEMSIQRLDDGSATTLANSFDLELENYDDEWLKMEVNWSELSVTGFVEDFEDQDWTDNFSVLRGDWSIVTAPVFEGTYAGQGVEDPSIWENEAVLLSNKTIPSFPLKFRYRVYVGDVSGGPDGDFWYGFNSTKDTVIRLAVKPLGTDNPMFALRESDGGGITDIESISPDFGIEEWLTVRFEHRENGDFAAEIDHTSGTQRISGNYTPSNTDLHDGKVGPRAYKNATYDLIEVNRTQDGGSLPDVI